MRIARLSISALCLLATTTPVMAHPGHGGHASAVFLHPLTGIDHLLAMFAVGVLAARLGGRALWAIPGSFLTMMAVGSLLDGVGVSVPAIELCLALSLIAVGAVIVIAARPSVAAGAAMAGAVATFHGYAHGSELGITSLTSVAPLLVATALLLGAGVALGQVTRRRSIAGALLGERTLGALMLAVGAALLLG
jgi:urease accessory protein